MMSVTTGLVASLKIFGLILDVAFYDSPITTGTNYTCVVAINPELSPPKPLLNSGSCVNKNAYILDGTAIGLWLESIISELNAYA